MASHNNPQKSVQHSRVSSSSSSHNQSYELIPREEPFSNLNRDLPSPRASFPFKKVQSGIETLIGKKGLNDYKGNIAQEKKQQKSEKELIQAKKELKIDKIIPKQKEDDNEYEIINKNSIQRFQVQIEALNLKISELQEKLTTQRQEFQLQKKANQIYSEGFSKIKAILVKKKVNLEGQSVEEVVQKMQQVLNKSKEQTNFNQLLEQQDSKIRYLRAQLLKSSQNNINAIFNTQITQAQCLHLQIKKMNGQIIALKQNIFKINSQNKIDANLFHNAFNPMKQHKVVNIYHHNKVFDSSDDQDFNQRGRKRKQTFSKSKRSKDSRDRSQSDSHKKSRRLTNTELKVGELIDGYKLLREEYRSLQQTIRQLNHNQSDYRLFFNSLKTQIQTSINNQIRQVKQTIKRPSSNLQERKIAKDLEGKLNHLINTLNAPERACTEKSLEEESTHERNSQPYRKLLELQAHNFKFEKEKKALQDYNSVLQQKMVPIQKNISLKYKEGGTNELCIDSIEGGKRKGVRKNQFEELINASRSDLKQEQIAEQFSGIQNNGLVIHPSSMNKLHSSQSYHQSNNKNSEGQHLHRKLQAFQEALRQKQHRITELQNTIIDHFQSKAVIGQPISSSELKQKYEIYINNLKILLSEAKKQNQILRKEFIKVNQLNLSRANQDQDRNSLTISSRTTKNPLAQTRMIQRRQAKPSNNYESIQLKLRIQDEFEKIFIALLELYQQSFELVEQDRRIIGNSLMNCLKFLLGDAKSKRNRLYEQTIEREQVKNLLNNLGFHQK